MDASLLDFASINPPLVLAAFLLFLFSSLTLAFNVSSSRPRKKWIIPSSGLLVILGIVGFAGFLFGPDASTTQAGELFGQQLEQVYGATTSSDLSEIKNQLEKQGYAELVLIRDDVPLQTFLVVDDSGTIQFSTAAGEGIEPLR